MRASIRMAAALDWLLSTTVVEVHGRYHGAISTQRAIQPQSCCIEKEMDLTDVSNSSKNSSD